MIENDKAYNRVIGHIKRQIVNGVLARGEKLPPERELSRQLGVSRNSVREALRALSVIGVVTSTQGAGNFISERFDEYFAEWLSMMYLLRGMDYMQFSELRQGLEIQAAKMALERITPRQLAVIADCVEKLAREQDENQSVVLDKRLHYTIALASGNRLILDVFSAVSNVMDSFISDMRKGILLHESSKNRLQKAHEDIADALKNRDGAKLLAAYEAHFTLIHQALAEEPGK